MVCTGIESQQLEREADSYILLKSPLELYTNYKTQTVSDYIINSEIQGIINGNAAVLQCTSDNVEVATLDSMCHSLFSR